MAKDGGKIERTDSEISTDSGYESDGQPVKQITVLTDQQRADSLIKAFRSDSENILGFITEEFTKVAKKHNGIISLDIKDFEDAKKSLLTADPDDPVNQGRAVLSLVTTVKGQKEKIDKAIAGKLKTLEGEPIPTIDAEYFDEYINELNKFQQSVEGSLSTSEGIRSAVIERLVGKTLFEQLPLMKADGTNFTPDEKKKFLGKITKGIIIPPELEKAMLSGLGDMTVFRNILLAEALMASFTDGSNKKLGKLIESKLTAENIQAFVQSVNDSLKVVNAKIVASSKYSESQSTKKNVVAMDIIQQAIAIIGQKTKVTEAQNFKIVKELLPALEEIDYSYLMQKQQKIIKELSETLEHDRTYYSQFVRGDLAVATKDLQAASKELIEDHKGQSEVAARSIIGAKLEKLSQDDIVHRLSEFRVLKGLGDEIVNAMPKLVAVGEDKSVQQETDQQKAEYKSKLLDYLMVIRDRDTIQFDKIFLPDPIVLKVAKQKVGTLDEQTLSTKFVQEQTPNFVEEQTSSTVQPVPSEKFTNMTSVSVEPQESLQPFMVPTPFTMAGVGVSTSEVIASGKNKRIISTSESAATPILSKAINNMQYEVAKKGWKIDQKHFQEIFDSIKPELEKLDAGYLQAKRDSIVKRIEEALIQGGSKEGFFSNNFTVRPEMRDQISQGVKRVLGKENEQFEEKLIKAGVFNNQLTNSKLAEKLSTFLTNNNVSNINEILQRKAKLIEQDVDDGFVSVDSDTIKVKAGTDGKVEVKVEETQVKNITNQQLAAIRKINPNDFDNTVFPESERVSKRQSVVHPDDTPHTKIIRDKKTGRLSKSVDESLKR